MFPLISVIVPVYKVEQYLLQCIQSIRNQTYENLEIILVDDGSPDNCPKMCDEYANLDRRIRVIHKMHEGLAEARNAGTSQAKGDYIVYIDSDDWVSEKMISFLYSILKKAQAQIAVCGLRKISKKGLDFFKYSGSKEVIYTAKQAVETMLYQNKIENSVCGKLLPTALCKKIPFPKGRLYEDLFTTYKFLWNVEKVVCSTSKLYYYRINLASIMHQPFNNKMFDELDAVDEMVAFIKEENIQLLPAANARKFSAYAQVLRWMRPIKGGSQEVQQKRKEIWDFLKAYRWEMLWDTKARAKNRVAALLTLLGSNIFVKL